MADGTRIDYEPNGDMVLSPAAPQTVAAPTDHFANLAVGHKNLDSLASTLTEQIAWDEAANEEMVELLRDNIELLGVGPESDPDDNDEPAADTSDHTLLLTALLRFQAKALAVMMPAPDKVCTTSMAFDLDEVPEETREKAQESAENAGKRVEKFMADYLYRKLKGYREGTDRILHECGLHGVGYRKVWTDYSRGSAPVRVDQIDINKLIVTENRKIEIIDMPTQDLIRNIRNGTYRADSKLKTSDDGDFDAKQIAEADILGVQAHLEERNGTHRIYDVHQDLYLENDMHPASIARPYIITIHAASQSILSIRRNWQENDPDEDCIERYVPYIYNPSSEVCRGLGLGHILGPQTRALRRAQRRALEAAYHENHPSGFKLSSMKIRSDATRIRAGEFVDVDAPTQDIRTAIMPNVFNGVSPGLIQLMDMMDKNGRELGGIASIDFTQLMKSGVAAGPAMAAYDESMEFQTAVHLRLYMAQLQELTLIRDRMREVYANQPVSFGVNSVLRPEDLVLVDPVPLMRPGQASKQREVLQARAYVDASNERPDIVDGTEAYRRYFIALGDGDIDGLLIDPTENQPEPADPLTEFDMIMKGEAVVAGLDQNHQAHIDAHAAQMRMIQNSQLPVDMGDGAMAQIASHIAEHMAMQLRVEVAARAGISMDQLEQAASDPRFAAQIAPAIAEQIVKIEAERRPPEQQGEDKTQLEFIKGQNARTLQQQKDSAAAAEKAKDRAHEKELAQLKEEGQNYRAEMDDDTAVEIASMKERNTAPTKAGQQSG